MILAVFAVAASKVFIKHPELHLRKKPIAAVIAGAGTLLFLISKAHSGGNGEDFKRPDRLITARFCASILGGFAAIITNITPISLALSAPHATLQATARDPVPSSKPVEVSTDSSPRESTRSRESTHSRGSSRSDASYFKVQGIFYQKNPSAIVNGKTVFVGDRVGHAKVVSIEREAVTLETSEQKVVLALRM